MIPAGVVKRMFETFPEGELDDIVGAGSPLIVVPHPDDESLGCGGLIAACCARGTCPVLVVVTDGAGSHPGSATHPPERLRRLREDEMRRAVAALGGRGEDIAFLRLPDRAAPAHGAAFNGAAGAIGRLAAGCTAILAPWQHDPHCDHEAAFLMARRAAAATGLPLACYPVWGWTLPDDLALPEPSPTGWRLAIGRHLPAKSKAISAHASQYSDVIKDDPGGFRLGADFLALFARPYEVFVRS